MKLGIVTDSTSDLPQHLIEEHKLEVIPTILILDGKEYADGQPNMNKLRTETKEHPIEKVGAKLREMMAWILNPKKSEVDV